MPLKPIFLSFLLLLAGKVVFADNFIVTSNADSGPGTLREAITLAANNGTSVTDIISFNIADTRLQGRTIDIQTEMPFLTSNLIIDGTTQPGSSIGVSDARIVIQLSKLTSNLRCFTIRDASNVEIYGLFFYQTYYNVFTSAGNNYSIYFRKVNNLTVGKPGKGNYFIGFSKGIANWIDANIPENYLPSDTSNTLIVQSNIFGLSLNGDLPSRTNTINGIVFTPTDQAVYLRNARNVLVGGALPSERNYIDSYDAITYASDSLKGNGYLRIYGNYIGGVNINGIVDLNGSSSTTNGRIWLKNTNSLYGLDLLVDIKRNLIGGNIDLGYLSGNAFIQANTITNTNIFTNSTSDGLYLGSALIKVVSLSGKVLIGGDNPSDGNDISQIRYVYPFPLPTYGQLAIQSSYSAILKGAVEIKNNIIHCNTTESSSIYNGSQGLPYHYDTDTTTLWVIIDSTGAGFVRGRSARNSRIDIYLDDECRACEGKQMIGSTLSDQDGKWLFTGNFTGVVVATATKNGNTYGFTAPVIIRDGVRIQQPTCKSANGSIKGLKMIGGDNFEWRYNRDGLFQNSSFYGNTTLDISNLKPGVYWLMGKLGNTCYGWKAQFDLRDYTPKINTQFVQVGNASCGQFNGSVRNITVDSAVYCRYEWRNLSGTVVGTLRDLIAVGPGSYKLFVLDTSGGGCIDSSLLYTVTNQSGPVINIDKMKITNTSCNLSNGNITGIQVQNSSGTNYFRWEDSARRIVGNQVDLSNIKAGKYRLQFKDAGGCDTITTVFYLIQNIGSLQVDTTGKSVKASGCNLNNGSIKNITVTGADVFEWKTGAGVLVSTMPELLNASPGTYQLTASNVYGCKLSTPLITVPSSNFIPISVSTSRITDASCGLVNGSIRNLVFTSDPSKYTFQWKDSLTGNRIATEPALNNLSEGYFILSATDSNGCSQAIFRQKINRMPKPEFDSTGLLVVSDQCRQAGGAIKNMKIVNLTGPAVYQWTSSNMTLSANTLELTSAYSDYYQLTVTDTLKCTIKSKPIFIKDSIVQQPAPVYRDTVIARNTPARLAVQNFMPGNYFLFNTTANVSAIDQNSSGIFITASLSADNDFYIQYRKGSCYSEKAKVSVKVVDETVVSIPNAFSPNGDGVNDVLKIRVTGLFVLKDFAIYDREGHKIFNTKDISLTWDGRYGGRDVPIGTYYYIIQGSDVYNKPVYMQGSITVLR